MLAYQLQEIQEIFSGRSKVSQGVSGGFWEVSGKIRREVIDC